MKKSKSNLDKDTELMLAIADELGPLQRDYFLSMKDVAMGKNIIITTSGYAFCYSAIKAIMKACQKFNACMMFDCMSKNIIVYIPIEE